MRLLEREAHRGARPQLVGRQRDAAVARAQLDDAAGLGEPHLSGDRAQVVAKPGRREVGRVVVVVQPPDLRVLVEPAPVLGHPRQHARPVDDVSRHEGAGGARPAGGVVIGGRAVGAAGRRLGGVVGLVPGRDQPHLRIRGEERADRGLVGPDAGQGTRRRRTAVAPIVIEGHERLDSRGRGRGEPRRHTIGVRPDRVPGHDEARRPDAESAEPRVSEHRLPLLADPHAQPAVGRTVSGARRRCRRIGVYDRAADQRVTAKARVVRVTGREQAQPHALACQWTETLASGDLHGRAGTVQAPELPQRAVSETQLDLRRSSARHVEGQRKNAQPAGAHLADDDAAARPTAGRTHDDDAPEEEAAVLVHPHGDLRRTLDLGPVRPVVRGRLGRRARVGRIRRVGRVRGIRRIAGVAGVAGVARVAGVAGVAGVARITGVARRAAVTRRRGRLGRMAGHSGLTARQQAHHESRRDGSAAHGHATSPSLHDSPPQEF